ncbi:MAG: hypothetical protein JWL61_2032 [Gemmatimonadetes bacterium]|nr:hypothetical protein [Gemmatimonadota bacterium]
MAKVKRVATKRTVRNVKPAKRSVKKTLRPTSKKKPAKKAKPVAVRKRTAPAKKTTPLKPAIKVDIKELDPIRKCGPGTSVQVLLKVVERVDGKSTNHLVFFDKYGWYCDHGRNCPAVAHARRQRGRRVNTR